MSYCLVSRDSNRIKNPRCILPLILYAIVVCQGCVNLKYVESFGEKGQIWSEESLNYIAVAEQAHNAAYQFTKSVESDAPLCKDNFRLCLRAWEKNAKAGRFEYLREVARLMLTYTQTLRAIASNAPLDELKKHSEQISAQMESTQAAYVNYRNRTQQSDAKVYGDFDTVGKLIFGVAKLQFDYQRDKAIRKLVLNRYNNINHALLLYIEAISALIDSTQVLAGDLHGDFEKFVRSAWSEASKTERLYIMQQSVNMNILQSRAVIKKICSEVEAGKCEKDKTKVDYKMIIQLRELMKAHDKLYEAAKSNKPLDFDDFKDLVSRLGKF